MKLVTGISTTLMKETLCRWCCFCGIRKWSERPPTHLNSVELSIQFTLEREKDTNLPFFHSNVCWAEQRSLENRVYHKPTHTDKYLASESHHPIWHKQSVTKNLLNNIDSKAEKRKYFIDILKVNGYIKTFLRNCTADEKEPTTGFAVIPYI